MKTITISKEEYERLKKKEAIADDAVVRLNLCFDDLRKGKVRRVA